MTDTTELATRLTRAERNTTFPNVRPRDAATLILVDRRGPVPKVLMGKRHPGHRFMPGKYVFPGGRVEPSDRRVPVWGALDRHSEERLAKRCTRPSTVRGRALALAAIRETFEETGLLLGTREAGAPAVPPGSAWEAFATHGVHPDLEALSFVARAITPPRRPKRFDTRFFIADATSIMAEVPGVVGPDSELVDLEWVPFATAKTMDLPTITQVIIEEIEARIAAGGGVHLPVPFYFMRRGTFLREEL